MHAEAENTRAKKKNKPASVSLKPALAAFAAKGRNGGVILCSPSLVINMFIHTMASGKGSLLTTGTLPCLARAATTT